LGRPNLGVERNVQQAARYYEMAAERGIPLAQYNLGVIHLHNMDPNNEAYVKYGLNHTELAFKYFNDCA
jgi:TPR repeat protein